MFKDYSTYQAADYLTDDYFVESMLEPTHESETFWKIHIDENKINVDEFISAYMTLKGLHDSKPEVPAERINILWERISNTNQKKVFRIKRFQIMRSVAVACSIIGIVGLSLFAFLKTTRDDHTESISDFAQENIIHTKQPTTQIQLVSGNHTLSVEGSQAKVEYNSDGSLKVNKKPVAVKQPSYVFVKEPLYSQLRVPYGKRAFLKLSDGTTLWMNTGTTVI